MTSTSQMKQSLKNMEVKAVVGKYAVRPPRNLKADLSTLPRVRSL
jgi:hypothetical protein